jgi:hypothetical protein
VKPVLALESEISRAIDIHYEGKVWEEKEKIAMRASRSVHPESVAAQLPREMVIERPTDRDRDQDELAAAANEAVRQEKGEAQPVSNKLFHPTEANQLEVIEGLIDLLVSKGIITRVELLRQILSKRV